MPVTFQHTFVDGAGNVASGEEVMDNLNDVNAGVHIATVTSLPTTNLINGQDVYYLADSTNGVVWHFKYRSASASTYKWEFAGGGSLTDEVATNEAVLGAGAYADTTTVGPDIVVPLAGDYLIEGGASFHGAGVSTAVAGTAAVKIGAAATADAELVSQFQTATNAAGNAVVQNGSRAIRRNVSAASTTVKLQYKIVSGAPSVSSRALTITPIRCI